MNIRIQSLHFTADQKLIDLIEEKINRLAHYIQGQTVETNVILKLEHVGQVQDKIIEVIINIPGQSMVAKSSKKSFEEALQEVISTLKTKLSRHKEKIQDKHQG